MESSSRSQTQNTTQLDTQLDTSRPMILRTDDAIAHPTRNLFREARRQGHGGGVSNPGSIASGLGRGAARGAAEEGRGGAAAGGVISGRAGGVRGWMLVAMIVSTCMPKLRR